MGFFSNLFHASTHPFSAKSQKTIFNAATATDTFGSNKYSAQTQVVQGTKGTPHFNVGMFNVISDIAGAPVPYIPPNQNKTSQPVTHADLYSFARIGQPTFPHFTQVTRFPRIARR